MAKKHTTSLLLRPGILAPPAFLQFVRCMKRECRFPLVPDRSSFLHCSFLFSRFSLQLHNYSQLSRLVPTNLSTLSTLCLSRRASLPSAHHSLLTHSFLSSFLLSDSSVASGIDTVSGANSRRKRRLFVRN